MILSRSRAALRQPGFGSAHDGERRGIHVPAVGRPLGAAVRPRYSVRRPKLKWPLRPNLPLPRRVPPRWTVIPAELAACSDRRQDGPMRPRTLTWFLGRTHSLFTKSRGYQAGATNPRVISARNCHQLVTCCRRAGEVHVLHGPFDKPSSADPASTPAATCAVLPIAR